MFIISLSDVITLRHEAARHINIKRFSRDVSNFQKGFRPKRTNNFLNGRVLAALIDLDKKATSYFKQYPEAEATNLHVRVIIGPLQPQTEDVVQGFLEQLPFIFLTERSLKLGTMLVRNWIEKNRTVMITRTTQNKYRVRDEWKQRGQQTAIAA